MHARLKKGTDKPATHASKAHSPRMHMFGGTASDSSRWAGRHGLGSSSVEWTEHQTPPAGTMAKLQVGDANDPLEREADDIADRVLRTPSGGHGGGWANDGFASRGQVGRSGNPRLGVGLDSMQGDPLNSSVRAEFEHRFGQSFDGVRVHTHDDATAACDRLGARAFTYGEHLFFQRGEFQPQTSAGRHVLAHELAHVLHQRESGRPIIQRKPTNVQQTGCKLEADLDIGIFAPDRMFDPDDPNKLVDRSNLGDIAKRWERGINHFWNGPGQCKDDDSDTSARFCTLELHATVTPEYEAKSHAAVQLRHANSVGVRHEDFHSSAAFEWGNWAWSDSGLTAAHEAGHLLGLADKYLSPKQRKKFKYDLMGNYPMDTYGQAVKKLDASAARARVIRRWMGSCPCCLDGLDTRPDPSRRRSWVY
jgi:hypothetical protein